VLVSNLVPLPFTNLIMKLTVPSSSTVAPPDDYDLVWQAAA
jgi:hypothetical protein